MAFDFAGTLTDFVRADTLALEALRLRCCPDATGPEFLDVDVALIMAFHERVERGESHPLDMDVERLTRTLARYGVTGARNAGMEAVIVHEQAPVRQHGLELGAIRAAASLTELCA